MLRFLRKSEPPDGIATVTEAVSPAGAAVTDDPLAAIGPHHHIYSVSRSVWLPRVTTGNAAKSRRVNPLFLDTFDDQHFSPRPCKSRPAFRSPPSNSPNLEKSGGSSGYGGSGDEVVIYHSDNDQHLRLMEDVRGVLLEQNPAYVKSIKIATCSKPSKAVPSQSSSSGAGTLTTIPEGKVDSPIPKPIWPMRDKRLLSNYYDSLVDDALLLYTSMNYTPEKIRSIESYIDMSVKDLLLELLHSINETLEGKNDTPPEDMLKIVNEKVRAKLDTLRASTEEEMKRLCINLSNCTKKNSVLRALSHSSSSGNSSKSTDWSGRVRTLSSETEDIYQVPSGSSSSGFSDGGVGGTLGEGSPGSGGSPQAPHRDSAALEPIFVHDESSTAGVKLSSSTCNKIIGTQQQTSTTQVNSEPKKSLLGATDDGKPSVWEQYYGVKAVAEAKYSPTKVKPTDVPLFPGGRPEADFTLDMPRSEHLNKRMKKDKRWRCRCRLLTSFLGVIFFLLSVMAVSLMLTRGKRMFGSMV